MLLDANVLLYAIDSSDPRHETAKAFLEDALNGSVRVAIPWQTITAFLRISTNPRAYAEPLSPATTWQFIDDCMNAAPAWIPPQTKPTADILGHLLAGISTTRHLVSDAALAAVAMEHAIPAVTNDSDFHRFSVTVVNPFA
jgi:toxin-antitoxin system PIN domain toxin